MARITCGSINGAKTSAPAIETPFSPPRVSASAAIVPRTVESTAVGTPITKLLTAADHQSGLLATSAYHRSDQPVGGNEKYCCALSDIGMMIRTGSRM